MGGQPPKAPFTTKRQPRAEDTHMHTKQFVSLSTSSHHLHHRPLPAQDNSNQRQPVLPRSAKTPRTIKGPGERGKGMRPCAASLLTQTRTTFVRRKRQRLW
jgi:hypothetical protein